MQLDFITEEELGRALCRLNDWEWDEEALGKKPEGFDEMPAWGDDPEKLYKTDFVVPAAKAIEEIIGSANSSRYWHKYRLDADDRKWFHYYIRKDFPSLEKVTERGQNSAGGKNGGKQPADDRTDKPLKPGAQSLTVKAAAVGFLLLLIADALILILK